MATAWKLYGVQTAYQTVNKGKPQGVDSDFSPDHAMVEVRVVLFKARSFDEAIRKAEVEAERYANEDPHRNRYGQKVRTKFLGYTNAYEIFDSLKPGAEVFSTTEIVPRKTTRESIVRRLIGYNSVPNEAGLRLNFSNILFSGTAPGVKPTPTERREYELLRR